MSRILCLLVVTLLSLQLAACGGPDCLSTCERLYRAGTDQNGNTQCNLGESRAGGDQFDRCMDECSFAMDTVGELGDYNPQEKLEGEDIPELKNDQQAAVWMDCVLDASCELLNKNVCAPVW